MSRKFTLRSLIEQLDGAGLVVTDDDLIEMELAGMGLELDDVVEVIEDAGYEEIKRGG